MLKFNIPANRNLIRQDINIWLSAVAICIPLLLLLAFLVLVIKNAFFAFWPVSVQKYQLINSKIILGELSSWEHYFNEEKNIEDFRWQVKQGNRDLYGEDFIWVKQAEIAQTESPLDAVIIERLEWGKFFGFIQAIKKGDEIITGKDALEKMPSLLEESKNLNKEIRNILKNKIGAINYKLEILRVKRNKDLKNNNAEVVNTESQIDILEKTSQDLEEEVSRLRMKAVSKLVMVDINQKAKEIDFSNIENFYFPNKLTFIEKIGLFSRRVSEFIFAEPRESNTEGGVFPAIFGTVALVVIMSILVTPLGVLAAIYLREYAKQGRFVSLIRIAVNNLAGVPSIVFGVCGVGFFIYRLGADIDQLFFNDLLPTPTFGTGGILWASLTLALLTLPTVIVSTEEGLAAIPKHLREASYALGATRYETLRKVILPCLLPSIFTGVILAIARAAGEVAPLMITGVVKLAPSMPFDSNFPFVHLERKFMHLGFHIYDMGFQSPNVDAARPMVFATTLLLLLIVVLLNLAAMILRNKLRKRFIGIL